MAAKLTSIKGLSKIDAGKERRESFCKLASEISQLGSQIGIRIIPYSSSDLPFFSALDSNRQKVVLRELSTFLRICHSTLSQGGAIDDSVMLSWMAIKELGLRPTSDLFKYISKDNVIEIHDRAGVQIFRNFKFFSCCSYSLEELYSFSWDILYKRDEAIFAQLSGAVMDIYDGKIKGVQKLNTPEHIIEEVQSALKYKIGAMMDYIAPLFDESGSPVATVVIEAGRLIGAPLSNKEEERLLSLHMQETLLSRDI